MGNLVQDVRYALRLLRKSPGFAIAAILTLALGLGTNTVMFGVLNTVLLRPLPYPHSEQLVQILETDTRRGDMHGPVSPYNFVDWRKQNRSFADMATYDGTSLVLGGRQIPVRVSARFVTASFFDVLEVPPLRGRTFLADEDQPGKPRVAVLSQSAWTRHFSADPAVVGNTILLDDQPYLVVGIMPADFSFPNDGIDFWCLPGFDLKQTSRGSHFVQAVGRLKPGVSVQEAQSEMNAIAANLSATYNQPGDGIRLVSLQEETVGAIRRALLVLWAAVIAVLMIACANVAGLMLARALSRRREVAIRGALGGSRWRIIRQFLTESVLLAMLGGALGLALSYWAGRFLVTAARGAVPRLHSFQIDGWVLAFTALACALTGLCFGFAPALSALRIDMYASLKEGNTHAGISERLRLRGVFVTVEIAVAMALLVSGGLLIESLWRLQRVDAGFRVENVLTFRFTIPQTKYPTSAAKSELYDRIVQRLAALPGVDSVGATNDLPFAGSRSAGSFDIEGRPPDPAVVLHADYRTVSPDYFQTMRIRLLEGRGFSAHDSREAPLVVVVNLAFAKKFFAEKNPIGHRLKIHEKIYEIVGVAADVKHQNLAAPAFAETYLSYLQADVPPWSFFVVRSRNDVSALIASVRNAVKEVVPDEPIYSVHSMSSLVDYWMSPQKFSSVLLSIFAGLALLLAAIGIYGMIAYSVVQRTREIGIRMALGAGRSDVLKLVLAQGARVGLFGLLGGTALALLAARALSSMLFEVNPNDFGTFTIVTASLILVVMLASYVPARRATLVDPLLALRHE